MTFDDLKESVSEYVGWGRDLTQLDSEQGSRLDNCVKFGYTRFLRPTCREHLGYRWNFLSPTVSLTITKGVDTYSLDSEIGAIIGEIYFDEAGYSPISCDVGETNIALSRAKDITGTPKIATVRIVKTEDVDGNITFSKELVVCPTPDKDYDAHYTAYLYVQEILKQTETVYGSEFYSDTIEEACLAAAEVRINDDDGVHNNMFNDMLLASIEQDLRETPNEWGNAGDKRIYSCPTDPEFRTKGIECAGITINGIEV